MMSSSVVLLCTWLLLCRVASFLHHPVMIRSLPIQKYPVTNTPLDMTVEKETDDPWRERDAAWLKDSNVVDYVLSTTDMQAQFGALAKSIGLNISSELSTRSVIPHHLLTASDLFCNRELNMEQIEAVGFDMDWYVYYEFSSKPYSLLILFYSNPTISQGHWHNTTKPLICWRTMVPRKSWFIG